MGASRLDTFQWGRERLRVGPWRGSDEVAVVGPLADAPLPSETAIRRCLAELRDQGFNRVVTGALSPGESHPFLSAGFDIVEHLHLLVHDLSTLPAAPELPLRRGRDEDVETVLGVDHLAFEPFWQLDARGLHDALTATPQSRFRLSTAVNRPELVTGYAVYGRAGRRGYLQRLAVRPGHRRIGTGSALVVDGLKWLRRWRVNAVMVNTQQDNQGALALYEHLGFQRQPVGLAVLAIAFDEASSTGGRTGEGQP